MRSPLQTRPRAARMMKRLALLPACFALLCFSPVPRTWQALAAEPKARPAAAAKPNPMTPIEDDPALPRVLLIGDSISIGYTLPVREKLKGKANVHRPSTNCGPTTLGLKEIDKWLGKGQRWDVIHFNWGLHDLKYADEKGTLVDDIAKGKPQVPLDRYEQNLSELVKRLKGTGATLIWCTTTPVPQGAKGRVPDDVLKYNEIAAKVMKENGVTVDDLYAFAEPKLKEIQLPADVHYKPDGYNQLADQVAASIEKALAAKQPGGKPN